MERTWLAEDLVIYKFSSMKDDGLILFFIYRLLI